MMLFPSPALLPFLLAGCFLTGLIVRADTVLDDFEYPSTEDLVQAWVGNPMAVVSLSDVVAPGSLGVGSMSIDFTFPRSAWTTETVRGALLPGPVSLATGRYVSFRLLGDPAFAVADFRNLYLYAYDASGRFGRWGTPVPATDEWQVVNLPVAGIEQPWDSPGLPDLTQVVRLSWFQYGSEAALDPYTATVHIDDLSIRDQPLNEFPPAAPARVLVDDFESYGSTDDLLAAYAYEVSPASTVATAALLSPGAQGGQALALAVDFSGGQYPWGSVHARPVAPFSFPSNAVVSFRFKGDPSLAAVTDDGTSLWLSFFDRSGRPIHLIRGAAAVTSADWITVQGLLGDFTGTATADIGNLVGWRILVQGWKGTPEQEPASAVFAVDDIRIEVPPPERPVLALAKSGTAWRLGITHLVVGRTYQVLQSQDLAAWSLQGTFLATSTTATRNLSSAPPRTYVRVIEKTP